jgi:hypothetical protein
MGFTNVRYLYRTLCANRLIKIINLKGVGSMDERLKQSLILNEKFSEEEIDQREEEIKRTFVYKKMELQLALSDAWKSIYKV